MQWSYHLGSTILATTSKFKIAVEIGVFRLIHEALYFCSTITATTSKSCGSFKLTCQLFTRLFNEYIYMIYHNLALKIYPRNGRQTLIHLFVKFGDPLHAVRVVLSVFMILKPGFYEMLSLNFCNNIFYIKSPNHCRLFRHEP